MSDPFFMPPTHTALTVLVVDDDLLIQRLLVAALHRLGHATAVVDSGEKMLDHLARHAVDVILLDVAMPGMDGLTALAELRRREVDMARRHYVIIVSGHTQDEEVRLARSDADGVVAKPVRLPALAAALARAARPA